MQGIARYGKKGSELGWPWPRGIFAPFHVTPGQPAIAPHHCREHLPFLSGRLCHIAWIIPEVLPAAHGRYSRAW
jgi:hypothetical protein